MTEHRRTEKKKTLEFKSQYHVVSTRFSASEAGSPEGFQDTQCVPRTENWKNVVGSKLVSFPSLKKDIQEWKMKTERQGKHGS